MKIKRRKFLIHASSAAIGATLIPGWLKAEFPGTLLHRVRPGDRRWPAAPVWAKLKKLVGGNLIRVKSPAEALQQSPSTGDYKTLLSRLKNPYFISNNPALTQTTGWVDAWECRPSVYAVVAKKAEDVAAAVQFANRYNLRLVIKGGGHSYQGTSNSADSLLIWTRQMDGITIHDRFILSEDVEGKDAGPAVTVEAGALWLKVYNEVTTNAGRYVQGGGCTTVGVAGLIQSGGFGSFSKNFGTAASSLLQAEVVTADGRIQIANKYVNPDLFWALKGGGGGGFAAVTKLTLKTHALPDIFGGVFTKIQAASDIAFQELIREFMTFYERALLNPTWGESVAFHGNNTMSISMVFQGIDQTRAKNAWAEFEAWVVSHADVYQFASPLNIIALPAKSFWDVDFFNQHAPQLIKLDDSPNGSTKNFYWASNSGEAGQYLYAYHSLWMPSSLLRSNAVDDLAEALFLSSRHWTVSLHFNKGLAGANPDVMEQARNTATNPAVLDAFALAIIAGEGPPALKGLPGYEAIVTEGREASQEIGKAFHEIEKLVPNGGAYVSESNYFQKDWQHAFWCSNYERLLTVKKKYDPGCLFFCRHGVGTEDWSDDGFTKLR